MTNLPEEAINSDDGDQSWPRKFGRSGRWSFCLMTGTLCPSNQERS